ncbi:hypothetical protein CEXT_421231 [Caerostris extrusa]|uniref:Uncharacterized protein n=1 Tax=Caerostris extrusa TaxID=172846 RepID=A0AAV4XYN2_CAEEX|nr:hypothetical protein CEXT_421231 [Caerostris extrusa]
MHLGKQSENMTCIYLNTERRRKTTADTALRNLRNGLAPFIIVDVPSEKYDYHRCLANRWDFKQKTKIPFPCVEDYSRNKEGAIIKRRYQEMDSE